MTSPLHTFHIPVMGLAYTIDSPIKVARFGINSVMSIIEDRLVEMMRKTYYEKIGEAFVPISTHEHDYRAKRITDYLNLVNRIVKKQVEELKASLFEKGSELTRYFEMLPTGNPLRGIYLDMLASSATEKEAMQTYLRLKVVPGSLDVNIMTKLDGRSENKGTPMEDGSDALSALRGYALSDLTNSSIIFSAGLNPRLFNYLEKFTAFDATGWGEFAKKIVVKVSDFRSALIQGKYLAKKGIWVSEFRIESGLNCGGHAFATNGYLMGPILEEFKTRREELSDTLHNMYNHAIQAKGKPVFDKPHPIKITAQGGIGTAEENSFLSKQYQLDGTGWGTPFLLCPEATTVDEVTLQKLGAARESDVMLSHSSPLGTRFHYLHGTSAEKERMERIEAGRPGSPCTEKHLAFNTEFTTDPICTASRQYQQLKKAQLLKQDLTPQEFERQLALVQDKECLCVGLSNAASLVYNQTFLKKLKAVTICPGPNIAYFSKVVTLQQMTDHIYGRGNVLGESHRPHMFIKELQLYVKFLAEQIAEAGRDEKRRQYCEQFSKNLKDGINYYRSVNVTNNTIDFLADLDAAEREIDHLLRRLSVVESV